MPIKRTNLQVRRVSSAVSMEVKYVNLLHAEANECSKCLGEQLGKRISSFYRTFKKQIHNNIIHLT